LQVLNNLLLSTINYYNKLVTNLLIPLVTLIPPFENQISSLKTRFCPQNQSLKTTCFTLVIKSSTSCSHVVLIGSTKGTSLNPSLSSTSVSFNIISRILKTSEACLIMSIKVTFAPIFGIINETSLGVTSHSNPST